MSTSRLTLMALAGLLALACDDKETARGVTLDASDTDATNADAYSGDDAASDGAINADMNLPEGEGQWLIVRDITEGISIGDGAGSDIDAVSFECTGRSGAPIAAFLVAGPREGQDASAALGAKDGPCTPVAGCAATLGMNGTLAIQLAEVPLGNCRFTLHEAQDFAPEEFEVYACRTPVLADCPGSRLLKGTDGQSVEGTFP